MQTTDSQTFKKQDATSYDDLTEQFDFFTERLSKTLAEQLITLAEIKPSDKILDIGTGTGVVALQAAEKIGIGGKVHGIDLSDGMLKTTMTKAERLRLKGKTEFTQMDAEKLEFADESFEKVVSLFALLHFPNPLIALQEIYRVLKPGGKLVVAVGSSPPFLSFSGILHRFKILPDLLRRKQGKQLVAPNFLNSLVDKHLSENPVAVESHLASHSNNRTGSIAQLVRRAGFKYLQTDWKGHQTDFSNVEEFWEVQRTFSSIARKRLNSATLEKGGKVKEIFFEECLKVQKRGGKLVYPIAAFYVSAQK